MAKMLNTSIKYNCSDVVKRPEQQEYCYNMPFCCKIVH